MRGETTEVIVQEIMRTNTIYEKLLLALSTPILLHLFYQLFGPEGEYGLSDKAFDKIVEELEIHDRLPEVIEEKSVDATLVKIFIELFLNEELQFQGMNLGSIKENHKHTTHLTQDDLLDLLNMAIQTDDVVYANELKKRLTKISKGSRKKINAN